jgi:hypothetical protein
MAELIYPSLSLRDELVADIPEVHCRMYDVDAFSDRISDLDIKSKSFSVVCINIRSMRKNFDQLLLFLTAIDFKISVIFITETWLCADSDQVFNICGYSKFSIYRNRHGGGIAAYVDNKFSARLVEMFTWVKSEYELMNISVSLPMFDLSLFCVYRPPSHSILSFNELFSLEVLSKLERTSKVVFCGDFNINLYNPLKLCSINNFIHDILCCNFYPVITKPTRLSPENSITSYSLLDHIWCNFSCVSNPEAGVIDCDLSDHLMTFFYFETELSTAPSRKKTRHINADNIHVFMENMRSFPSLAITNINDPNLAMRSCLDELFKIYNSSFPIKSVVIKKRGPPWVTTEIKSLIKKKHKLLKLSRSGAICRGSYSIYRNVLNVLLKIVKKQYYSTKIQQESNDSRALWNTVNSILAKNIVRQKIELYKNNKLMPNSELTIEFNEYFISVANDITKDLGPVQGDTTCGVPFCEASCFLSPTSASEIKSLLRLCKGKRLHVEEIQPRVLCEVADIIAPVLAHIFNLCMSTGVYPDVLKHARVIPIFKSGNPSNVCNYRPISTLPFLNKIFEKILHSRLTNFLDKFSLISDRQFGFRKGTNTTMAIFYLVQDLLKEFHAKNYCIALFLDLQKAFDCVNHQILLNKLYRYGIRGPFYTLIKSYLTNREQHVSLSEFKSPSRPITIGVPQGSVLGPLLFNIFINDIASSFNVNCKLFADDAVFYISKSTYDEACDSISDLSADLSRWLLVNKLVAHTDKTKLMLFTSRPVVAPRNITFNGSILDWVDDFRYLGLILDNKMSFKKHITSVCQGLSKAHGVLHALSFILPFSSLKTLFYSLFISKFSNTLVIWGGVPLCTKKPVITLMNRTLRSILRVRYVDNVPLIRTNELYRQSKILKLDDMYKFKLLQFMNRALFHDQRLFESFFAPLVPQHFHDTRGVRLNLPPVRLEIEKNGTVFNCVKHFNELPDDFRINCSQSILKTKFRDFILAQY